MEIHCYSLIYDGIDRSVTVEANFVVVININYDDYIYTYTYDSNSGFCVVVLVK